MMNQRQLAIRQVKETSLVSGGAFPRSGESIIEYVAQHGESLQSGGGIVLFDRRKLNDRLSTP